MDDLWRARRWVELLDLIDGLPEDSLTHEAMANDEEYVRAAVASIEGRPDVTYHPRRSQYSGTEGRLDRLIDAVREGNAIAVAAAGGKPQRIEPQPRPISIFERVQHEEREQRYRRTVERVLGPRAAAEGHQEQHVEFAPLAPAQRHRRTVLRVQGSKVGADQDDAR